MAVILLVIFSLLWSCSASTSSYTVRTEVQYRYAAQPQGHNTPASRCVVCHSLEKDGPHRVAPTLWGIIGADKSRFEGCGYSTALARAEGVWTKKDSDTYLTDPDKFVPGTKKTLIGIAGSRQRKALIDFRGTLRDWRATIAVGSTTAPMGGQPRYLTKHSG